MKRRNFLSQSMTGALGLGFAGCSSLSVKRELSPHDFDKKGPKPVGTMPMAEIGKTGIKVSKFGFGSHMRKDIVPFEKEREWMVREAYDLGVTFFDVYDYEQECFQYEPMGRFLAPIINDVVISISILPWEGRSFEQELERDLKLFGRDHIDLVRVLRPPENPVWETLFKFKEKGYIRAVGAPIHDMEHVDMLIGKVPIDYILFPYNFYHNICWLEEKEDNFDSLPARLRENGIGVATMKPFAGDYLVQPFIDVARQISKNHDISFTQAALRYVINSGIHAETTLVGMYNLPHLYDNVAAYYNPAMSDEERELLDGIRKVAVRSAHAWLPDHYKWLDNWAGHKNA